MDRPMASARSLSEFQKAFPDEARCVAFLFQRRWPDGFVCPCGKRRAVALKSRPRLYECLDVVDKPRSRRARRCIAPSCR